MITVKHSRDATVLTGHAARGKAAASICAVVSTLVQTLKQSFPSVVAEPGHAVIPHAVRITDRGQFVLAALENLAMTSPGNVRTCQK